MTRDDIIRMAREAGIDIEGIAQKCAAAIRARGEK